MSKAAHTLLSLSVAPVRIHKVIEAMNASPRGGRHVVHVGERFDLRQFLLLLLVGQGRGGHNGRECTWGGGHDNTHSLSLYYIQRKHNPKTCLRIYIQVVRFDCLAGQNMSRA